MQQGFCNLIWNVVGGLLVASLIYSISWIRKRFSYWRFKQVFGDDTGELFIVFPSYNSPSTNTIFPKPPLKVPRPKISATTHLSTINSSASTRGISHLSYTIGNCSSRLPKVRSDIDLDERMDISFISLGGFNNCKTIDVLENSSNIFLEFGTSGIQSKTSGRSIANIQGNVDCGLILKIHPDNNQNRTWLCVAGLGEWGTSGASWWLSKHWPEIYKRAKNKPFACITKTTYRSDDSTSLVHLFLSEGDVENTA